jgi:uncharacterized Zn-finger protein
MCILCDKKFKRQSHIVRHISFSCNKDNKEKKYQCNLCFLKVSRKDALMRHKKKCKNKEQKNIRDYNLEVFNDVDVSNNFELFSYYEWY